MISVEWQQVLEEAGRRQSDACATMGYRKMDGRRELALRNGHRENIVMVYDADLQLSIEDFKRKVLLPAVTHAP